MRGNKRRLKDQTIVTLLLAAALLIIAYLAGCSSNATQMDIDYERTEWVETYAKPAVHNCLAARGYLLYRGQMPHGLRLALDENDWSKVRRVDFIGLSCVTKRWQ